MNTNFMQQTSMKNAGKRIEHSDQAPVFTPTIRMLQCGHAVWGKIDVNEIKKTSKPTLHRFQSSFKHVYQN
jgi:hypothetical protein